MPPSPLSLTLIVAATPSMGIGRAGALPWPMLRSEMAYFARVTKRAAATDGVNAVIMGRRTWESIPPSFRPLKGRVNVVVSRSSVDFGKESHHSTSTNSKTGTTASVLSAPSLEGALALLESRKDLSKVFVIGGAELYRSALNLPNTTRVLLTRIKMEFECDVFFPLSLKEEEGQGAEWRKAAKSAIDDFTGENVPEGVQSEKDVEWEFEMWERDSNASGS